MLEAYDIIHAFFHAPLDDADFGNSRSIATVLGLVNCRKIIPYQYDYYWGITGWTYMPSKLLFPKTT